MRHTQGLIAAVVCWLAGTAAAAPPPVEAYGRLPAIVNAALSPDGKRVAVAVGFEFSSAEPDRDLTTFRIINIDTGQIEHTLAPPPRNTLRGVGWAGDRRPFYYVSMAADAAEASASNVTTMRGPRVEFVRTGVFSLDTKAVTQLMQNQEFRANSVLANLQAPIEGDENFGRMIVYGGAGGGNMVPRRAVYRVNLENGKATATEVGNADTRNFLLDEKGAVVARIDVDDRSNRWRLFDYRKGKDRMILEQVTEMGIPLSLYGVLPDGRIAAVNPHKEGARDTLLAIDRESGKSAELYKTNGYDIWANKDPWLQRIVGAGWSEDLPKQLFFDPQLEELRKSLQPYFADGYVTLESWSRDRSRALVFGERANDAGAYYIYEVAAKKLRSVGKRYPALSTPESLGDRRAIKYKSRDGTQIPAYLTLPAGVEPKNLPLVLLVHGGPHARDYFTFDWWASFLASRGYAVLQPNYRGSTGYGYEWFDKGRGAWGDGLMQTDVEDGADALVKSGYVDAKRICIMGGSYGGYAALAGATITPDRYACAVSVNGVSDPERMLNNSEMSEDGKKGMSAEWWAKSMGNDLTHLRKVSPLEQADKARAPILILHGKDDSVVPIEQSRNMASKLKSAGKSVRFVELPGDDHWLSSAITRTQALREMETFLAENLAKK